MGNNSVRIIIGLVVLHMFGCVDTNTDSLATPHYTVADSIGAKELYQQLDLSEGHQDTAAMRRSTYRMLRSPYVRSNLQDLFRALQLRGYANARPPYHGLYSLELDSMTEDAELRHDTLMLFAFWNAQASEAMRNGLNLGSALALRERALRLDPDHQLVEQVPYLYRDLASASASAQQWERSIQYSRKLLNASERKNDFSAEQSAEVEIAMAFQQLGMTDSIDRHLANAKELLTHTSGNPFGIAPLAGLERKRGRYAEVRPLLRSMLLANEQQGIIPLTECSACISELAWAELHEGNPQKAKIIAETMARGQGLERYRVAELAYHQVMDTIELALGNFQKAYMHRSRYMAMRDSMNLNAAAANLQNIENNYKAEAEHAQRQLEAAAAANLLQRERSIRNIMIAGVLFAAVIGFFRVRQRRRIQKEMLRSHELLLNILPEEVADELKAKGHADAKHFDSATILFTDFKGFTEASEKLSPKDLVEELNVCFMAFDHIISARGIEKIKTIGDAYMCVGGLPDPKSSTPAEVVRAALEMQAFMIARKTQRDAQGLSAFEMRLGIHTGPVVAGIVGVKKFQYDIWGDTVNTASRMESSGEVGQVNISEATHELVKDEPDLSFTSRGKVQTKGKGEMEMYFVKRI